MCSLSNSQLPIQQALGDPPILHAADMAKPVEAVLLELNEGSRDLNMGRDFIVSDGQYIQSLGCVRGKPKVEIIQFPFLSGVENPGLAAIEQCGENAGSVDCYFSVGLQFGVFPDLL